MGIDPVPERMRRTGPASGAGRRVLVTGGSGFIGAHLVGQLVDRTDTSVVSVDITPPWVDTQREHWTPLDIRDRSALREVLTAYDPTHVVHLAAETDADPSHSVEDYPTILQGTQHLLDAVRDAPSPTRLVIASTQFVCRPGHLVEGDEDFDPHTAYGQAKVRSERMVRDAQLPGATWTIVRPTTIWGPGDDQYRRAFHALMRRGLYVHPGVGTCRRSYGYVGNVVWQVEQLLARPAHEVHGQVFYLGDPMFDVRDFVDAFHRGWHGRPARTIPVAVAKGLARAGTWLERRGLPFPINEQRFASLSTSYPVPIDRTIDLLGSPPYTLAEGVAHTVAWLRGEADPIQVGPRAGSDRPGV